ncbi:MAG: hypothetical protein DSY66_05170 [Persephonella sp.]|nr:MAG: hypothetical protein DSY53_02445 [Persephonella sp.]RUM59963.1 MAG: hypothetical protein DSY66_05170 [Persephonella sp.]
MGSQDDRMEKLFDDIYYRFMYLFEEKLRNIEESLEKKIDIKISKIKENYVHSDNLIKTIKNDIGNIIQNEIADIREELKKEIENIKNILNNEIKNLKNSIENLKENIENLRDEIIILKRRINYQDALANYMATHNGSLESFYPTVTFTTDNILPDEDEEIPAYRR